MYKRFAAATLLASGALFAQTQTDATSEKKLPFTIKTPNMKIEPYAQLQGWGTYSMGRETENNGQPGLDKAENRANFYLRRARLGFRGQPYQNLSYQLSMYYDNAGHDSQANTRNTTLPAISSNGSTAGGPATVGLWDSFLSWKVSEGDMFHVTVGYFRPQISRENITAAFNVSSFEKAQSQWYVRQSVTGRGFGRNSGINVGGLSADKKFNWNAGIFNKVTTGETVTPVSAPTTPVTLGETQGSEENSLVYVGRVAYSFGDPEMEKYGLGYIMNYFGKRKGITFGLNGSTQDSTPRYAGNKVIGSDFLFNNGPWTVDGEFFYIYKRASGAKDYSRGRTGHIRAAYAFFLKNGTVLEPSVMYSGYYGEEGADYTGRDLQADVGLNWYLDQNRYKFYIHYVKQDGDGNNLVHRETSGGKTGAFHYGDYAGIGLTLQI